MKRIFFRYFPAVLLVSVILTSCKKLIEIPVNPKNQLSKERVFADSVNIIAAVAGIYSNFGISSTPIPGFFSGGITVYTGLTGDELLPGSDIYNAPELYSNNILADNNNIASIWSGAYKSIFEINLCLEGIATTKAISEGLKRQLIAELKVSRAFCYFNMVNIWGGVPIITSTDYKKTQSIPRASVDSVYSFILTDLTDAAKNLTPLYPSEGRVRPNLYVAQSLLSKVYLYLEQYEHSIDAANIVINSNIYALPDVSEVFLSGSPEAIWQLPANGNFQATPEATAFVPYATTITPNYLLSTQLLNAFEPDDLRKAAWLNFNVVEGSPASTAYYPYKYKNLESNQTPVEDYTFLRLADIYLIRAEARAHLGNLEDAITDLNTVRGRAGLKDTSIVLQGNLLKAIMHERQVELFCEWGNRWFDLKRTKAIDAVLTAVKPSWMPWAALFPIPRRERQANPFLTPNPGYE